MRIGSMVGHSLAGCGVGLLTSRRQWQGGVHGKSGALYDLCKMFKKLGFLASVQYLLRQTKPARKFPV